MKCKNCKFWNTENRNHDHAVQMGLGKCDAVLQFWDATEWSEDGDKRQFKKEARNCMAFSEDGSDYMSWLYTKAEFGCVQFEQRG